MKFPDLFLFIIFLTLGLGASLGNNTTHSEATSVINTSSPKKSSLTEDNSETTSHPFLRSSELASSNLDDYPPLSQEERQQLQKFAFNYALTLASLTSEESDSFIPYDTLEDSIKGLYIIKKIKQNDNFSYFPLFQNLLESLNSNINTIRPDLDQLINSIDEEESEQLEAKIAPHLTLNKRYWELLDQWYQRELGNTFSELTLRDFSRFYTLKKELLQAPQTKDQFHKETPEAQSLINTNIKQYNQKLNQWLNLLVTQQLEQERQTYFQISDTDRQTLFHYFYTQALLFLMEQLRSIRPELPVDFSLFPSPYILENTPTHSSPLLSLAKKLPLTIQELLQEVSDFYVKNNKDKNQVETLSKKLETKQYAPYTDQKGCRNAYKKALLDYQKSWENYNQSYKKLNHTLFGMIGMSQLDFIEKTERMISSTLTNEHLLTSLKLCGFSQISIENLPQLTLKEQNRVRQTAQAIILQSWYTKGFPPTLIPQKTQAPLTTEKQPLSR